RRLPVALRRQIAHHRAGAQIGAVTDDALGDEGLQHQPVPALQHHLAALAAALEGRVRQRAGGRRLSEEVADLGAIGDKLGRRGAEPVGQGLVDEEEAPGAVDRIKPDRRVIEKIRELRTLVADFAVDQAALRYILEIPQAQARAPGEAMRGDAEPGDRPGGVADRDAAAGTALLLNVAPQTRQLAASAVLGGKAPGERVERRVVESREESIERRVGVDDLAIAADDEM